MYVCTHKIRLCNHLKGDECTFAGPCMCKRRSADAAVQEFRAACADLKKAIDKVFGISRIMDRLGQFIAKIKKA